MGYYLEEINGWILINDECRIRKRDVSYYQVYYGGQVTDQGVVKYLAKTDVILVGGQTQKFSSKHNTKEEAEKNADEGMKVWDEIMGIKKEPEAVKKEASEIL